MKISKLFTLGILSLVLTGTVLTGCSQKVEIDKSVQGKKTREYSNPKAVISAEQLKNMQDDNNKDLVVIGILDSAKALIPGNLAGKPIDGSYTVWRSAHSSLVLKELLGAKEVYNYDGWARVMYSKDKVAIFSYTFRTLR